MRRVLAAALLVLGLALALAGPAGAEHRKFRIATTELPRQGTADMRAVGSTGVDVLRFNLSWVRIEDARPTGGCSTADYDWDGNPADEKDADYDEMVRRASASGVKLLPTIVGSPRYVAPNSGQQFSTHAPYTGDPAEKHAYTCFIRAAVARYGRGGTLPTQEGVRPITQWQVWNEPNFTQYGTEEHGADPREYSRLVELTANQIRGIDPLATIVLGGMPGDPRGFLRGMYVHPGIERKFDAVSIHAYAKNYRGVEGAVLRMRDTLRSLGDSRRELWITEVGWSTHTNKALPWLVKTPEGQARQLRKTFNMLSENKRQWRLGTVAWFRWRDTHTVAENKPVFEYMGLYAKGGRPKPACQAYIRFTDGVCNNIP